MHIMLLFWIYSWPSEVQF